MKNYTENVFINCPFDQQFNGLFNAMVFSIFDCGFIARCALEESNGADIRIEKILNIIKQSKYGIHDISRTEFCKKTRLPRFNMPLELGMFLGGRKFGDFTQKQKVCLIMDRTQYRYEKYISDIKGQDILAHGNRENKAIGIVTDWLRTSTRRKTIPGGREIARRYKLFKKELPALCAELRIQEDELKFNDYAGFVSEWIRQNSTA